MTTLSDLRCDYTQSLGRGGFGEVYLGYIGEKKVAVKRCSLKKLRDARLDPHNEERILKEFQSLKHQHIIEYYFSFKDKDYFCYVMEYCKGGSLFDHVYSKGPYKPKKGLFNVYYSHN